MLNDETYGTIYIVCSQHKLELDCSLKLDYNLTKFCETIWISIGFDQDPTCTTAYFGEIRVGFHTLTKQILLIIFS